MHNKIHRYSLMKQVHDDKLAMLGRTSMTTTPHKASVLQFTLLFTCVHTYAWFLAYLSCWPPQKQWMFNKTSWNAANGTTFCHCAGLLVMVSDNVVKQPVYLYVHTFCTRHAQRHIEHQVQWSNGQMVREVTILSHYANMDIISGIKLQHW